LEDESTKIADMSIVVDRRATAVYADLALMQGLEGLQPVGKRVVEAYLCHFQRYGKRKIVAEAQASGKPVNGNAIADRQYGIDASRPGAA
jgi:hypothetical protein